MVFYLSKELEKLIVIMSLSLILAVYLEFSSGVAYEGNEFVFTCRGSGISSYSWLINGTRFADLSLNNVNTFFIPGKVDFPSIEVLTFVMVNLEYNRTAIQCEAIKASGSKLLSNTILLLVQGAYLKV